MCIIRIQQSSNGANTESGSIMSAAELIKLRSSAKLGNKGQSTTQRSNTPKARSTQNNTTNQLLMSSGRVKVGVRIRPPFQDEIDVAQVYLHV